MQTAILRSYNKDDSWSDDWIEVDDPYDFELGPYDPANEDFCPVVGSNQEIIRPPDSFRRAIKWARELWWPFDRWEAISDTADLNLWTDQVTGRRYADVYAVQDRETRTQTFTRVLSLPVRKRLTPEIKQKLSGWNLAQIKALLRLMRRFRIVADQLHNFGEYTGVDVVSMFIGIEKDGYTHT